MNDFETGRSAEVGTESVETRRELSRMVKQMLADLQASGEGEWENPTLERYLDALGALLESDGNGCWGDVETPTWQLFARYLLAATGYE